MKQLSFVLVLFLTSFLQAETAHQSSDTVTVCGLSFVVPKTWVDAKPLNPVRARQWTVPALKSGGAPGEVVIFFFGAGQGGDTKSNIDRWLTNVTAPDGSPAQSDITMRSVNGFKITQLLVFGTYTNPMAATPGMPATPKPGFGLIGAVIERPEGSFFFRFTGPEALIKSQLVPFTKFLDSVKSNP